MDKEKDLQENNLQDKNDPQKDRDNKDRGKGAEYKYYKNGRKFRFFVGIRLKTALAVLLLSVVFFLAMVFVSLTIFRSVFSFMDVRRARQLADSVVISLDSEELREMYRGVREEYETLAREGRDQDPESGAYRSAFAPFESKQAEEIKESLLAVAEQQDVERISFYFTDEARGRDCFIADVSLDDDIDIQPVGGWTATRIYENEQDVAEMYEEGKEALPQVSVSRFQFPVARETLPNGRKLLYSRTEYSPEGEKLGYVSVSARTEFTQLIFEVGGFTVIAALIPVVLLMILVSILVINQSLVRPLRLLTKAAVAFGRERDESSETRFFQNKGIKSHDEVRILADVMEDMEQQSAEYMKNLKLVTQERQRISTELDVAARLQASMLPDGVSGFGSRQSFRISAVMRPAKEVAGDFYDYFTIDEDRQGLVIADVSGKGVPAALFMVVSRTLVKNALLQGISPGPALELSNRQLCENNEENMFVTVWAGIYDASTGRLVSANAGHEYPAVFREGKGYSIKEADHDPPLGIDESFSFRETELTLEAGDRIFVYTDGVPEANNSEGGMYGVERMVANLNRLQEMGGRELLEAMEKDVDAFAGDEPQFDDITMLLLEVREEKEDHDRADTQ